MGEKASDEEIKAMFKKADLDDDGFVTFEDFYNIMTNRVYYDWIIKNNNKINWIISLIYFIVTSWYIILACFRIFSNIKISIFHFNLYSIFHY